MLLSGSFFFAPVSITSAHCATFLFRPDDLPDDRPLPMSLSLADDSVDSQTEVLGRRWRFTDSLSSEAESANIVHRTLAVDVCLRFDAIFMSLNIVTLIVNSTLSGHSGQPLDTYVIVRSRLTCWKPGQTASGATWLTFQSITYTIDICPLLASEQLLLRHLFGSGWPTCEDQKTRCGIFAGQIYHHPQWMG